jgi:hypothetical protein
MNEKYYIIKKKNLAEAINFVTGMKYYILDDRLDSKNKFYSFENTEVFRKALTELTQLKSKLNSNI